MTLQQVLDFNFNFAVECQNSDNLTTRFLGHECLKVARICHEMQCNAQGDRLSPDIEAAIIDFHQQEKQNQKSATVLEFKK